MVLPIEGQGTQIAITGVVIGGTRSFDGLGSGSPSERDRTHRDVTFIRPASRSLIEPKKERPPDHERPSAGSIDIDPGSFEPGTLLLHAP